MRRRILAAAFVLLLFWGGAFGIALAVVEWRSGDSFDPAECQAAISFWETFVEGKNLGDDLTAKAALNVFERCGHPFD